MVIPSNGVTQIINHPCWVREKSDSIKDRGYLGKTASAGKEIRANKIYSSTNTAADLTPILLPVIKHYDIATDEYHSYHVEIPEAADNIIRQDCSLKEAHPLAKIKEIQHTALLLFAGYMDAATS